MPTDLEIARQAELRPIHEVAWTRGIEAEVLIPYGHHMAKIAWEGVSNRIEGPRGALVLVTSVNPPHSGKGRPSPRSGCLKPSIESVNGRRA